ncbi:MAG: SDR family NAD(P)-dependent oxidoreductase [Bacteroidales bacterium]
MERYVFSGTGFVPGQYSITNQQIEQAIDEGFLYGFNKIRVEQGDSYNAYLEEGGKLKPFSFIAEHKMGFRDRRHVVPFPPAKKSYPKADNSLDLAIKASRQAIDNAGLSPQDIDMWMVSTATAHEKAPGLAATLKCYFVPFDNQTPTHSLTSACVGFNINLELAIQKMKQHPDMKHILLVHTEVMSELLCNEKDFVPLTSFGDASAAVVLSRIETKQPVGVQHICNYEDLRMIDFLGADKYGDMYMEPRVVKSRAVPNMVNVAMEISKKDNKKPADYDYYIPHQTGHAIVKSVIKAARIPDDICCQDVQLKYGNLSGASVPASYHELLTNGKLKPGMHILTSVAGLGGEYGGFSYIVPEAVKFDSKGSMLEGKTVFITGSTGDLAQKTIEILADQHANLLLHYRNDNKLAGLKDKLKKYTGNIQYLKADLAKPEEVENMAKDIKSQGIAPDYLIHIAAATGNLKRASEVTDKEMKEVEHVNHRAARIIIETLFDDIKEAVLFVGSVAEEALFSGSSAYVASKRALHAYAVDLAMRYYQHNKRVVYYMPGIIDGGMMGKLSEAQKSASMQSVRQTRLIELDKIADNLVKSLYLPKIQGVEAEYEGALMVRRDGYLKEDLS